MISLPVVAFVIVLLAVIATQIFKILNEYERGVVFTFGRFTGVKGPGLIILIPLVQRMVKVDLRVPALSRLPGRPRWIGVGGALFFLPLIALGGYGYAAFGASLLFMKWLKAFENGTDYSMMKTGRSSLFLITSREEKYKAQAAIETFFVRGGDSLNAIVVWIGTTYLAMSIEGFAAINVVGILIWVVLCVLIAREYKKRKAKIPAATTR